jgi:hypothetical protein
MLINSSAELQPLGVLLAVARLVIVPSIYQSLGWVEVLALVQLEALLVQLEVVLEQQAELAAAHQ